MDRRSQLKNVAFGGAWSEQIAGDEALQRALASVREASKRTAEEDLRGDLNLLDAVWALALTNPKGDALAEAWRKALNLQIAGDRVKKLRRLADLFAARLTARLSHRD